MHREKGEKCNWLAVAASGYSDYLFILVIEAHIDMYAVFESLNSLGFSD